jgi:hypothetical protein
MLDTVSTAPCVRRAVGGAYFDSPEGYFIIYRVLVAQPWPERLADPGMRAVRLLGRIDPPGHVPPL